MRRFRVGPPHRVGMTVSVAVGRASSCPSREQMPQASRGPETCPRAPDTNRSVCLSSTLGLDWDTPDSSQGRNQPSAARP